MAVMHKTTFDLYHNDQNIVPKDYAAIDELIAPAIQVLNQKGYTTKYCCSGHPLKDWLMRTSKTEEGYEKSMAPIRSYIAFADGITLPSLPPGFTGMQITYKADFGLVIEKYFIVDDTSDNPYFALAQTILDTMKQLYVWALELPEFSDIGYIILNSDF